MTATQTAPVAIDLAAPDLALDHFLTIAQLSTDQLVELLDLAASVKASPALYTGALQGLSITLLFEKPSLRTRMSLEIGLTKLGAHAVYFDHGKQRIGERESIKDYAKNLERWTDMVVARVFEHGVLEGLAEHASIPVVNALSDLEHPCQALADMLTLIEHLCPGEGAASLAGKKLAWIGDGNNVCHSLMLAAAKLGMDFTAVTPRGFEPSYAVVAAAVEAAEASGAKITISHKLSAVKSSHAVYTDTWVSMGQEHHGAVRAETFANFTVDTDTMKLASEGLGRPALFMHCLPAHRGEEVTDAVIDSPQSVVYDQAENRMHTQNALAIKLLGSQ